MPRILSSLLRHLGALVLFLSWGLALALEGADIQAIKQAGILKAGVKDSVMGLSFKDPLSDEYQGFEVELVTMIAQALKVNPKFITTTSGTREQALHNHDTDLIAGNYCINEERLKYFDFSPTYYIDHVTVLVEDRERIHSLKDLIGHKIGITAGANSARVLLSALVEHEVINDRHFDDTNFDPGSWDRGLTFKVYDDYPLMSVALSQGEISGMCTDRSILQVYRTRGRSFINEDFAPQPYGIAIRKGSDLGPLISDLINGWLMDGTITRLINKYHLN